MSRQNFHIHDNAIPPYEFNKVDSFIKAYKPSMDINYIIEIYLVMNLLKTETKFKEFKYLIKQFKDDIYENMPESIFRINYDDVNVMYRDSFWKLLLTSNKINKKDADDFATYIKTYTIQLIHLSSIAEIIDIFPTIVKDNFLALPENIEFFLNHQSGKYIDSSKGLFIKVGLTNKEVNDLAKKYCESDLANPNYLQSIVDYKKLSQYYFEDEVKLLFKRTINKFWENHFQSHEGLSYSHRVSIAPIANEQLFSFESKGMSSKIVINKNVLDNYHDFPTLLNNYIYVLGFFNYETGLPWLVANSETVIFSEIFSPKSNANYNDFDKHLKLNYSLLFYAYFDYLKNNEIDLEEIIEWYFNIYLKEELGVQGFRFNASNKESSYYERSKSITSEVDSVLGQFELYKGSGEIDVDLLSMKSQFTSYSTLKSLKNHKFLKLKINTENNNLFSTLFSDQSHIGYISSNKDAHTFLRLIEAGVSIHDFSEFQQRDIEYLIEKNLIELVDDGIIKFKDVREIKILYKIWKTGTFCLFYKSEIDLQVAQNLVEKNFCEYTNKVFSEAEINYLSYILDDKKYGNGPKIRNKFTHGKFSYLNEEQQLENYLELLQIAIFYVIRINDELEYYVELNDDSLN